MDYSRSKYTLWFGDCIQVMGNLPNKIIDMILCDLPYGVLNKSNSNAKWDVCIPMDSLWDCYRRILKPNGVVILFGQGMFTSKLMESNPSWWRYNLVWDKMRCTGFLNSKRMPLRCHEDIAVFYRKQPAFHPQMIQCNLGERSHSRKGYSGGKNSCYGEYNYGEYIPFAEKYPRSIISIPREHKTGEFYHPTQKPVELMRYLIRSYTSNGDIILDNCMGSGSTGVAAMMEKRRFIGIEIDAKYFDIASCRIKEVESKFFPTDE